MHLGLFIVKAADFLASAYRQRKESSVYFWSDDFQSYVFCLNNIFQLLVPARGYFLSFQQKFIEQLSINTRVRCASNGVLRIGYCVLLKSFSCISVCQGILIKSLGPPRPSHLCGPSWFLKTWVVYHQVGNDQQICSSFGTTIEEWLEQVICNYIYLRYQNIGHDGNALQRFEVNEYQNPDLLKCPSGSYHKWKLSDGAVVRMFVVLGGDCACCCCSETAWNELIRWRALHGR